MQLEQMVEGVQQATRAILPESLILAVPHTTICSVYFREVRHEIRQFRGTGNSPRPGFIEYVVPAAERNGYRVLPVFDGTDLIMDTTTEESELGHRFVEMPMPARLIAQDLVRQWATGMRWSATGGGPGIGVILGTGCKLRSGEGRDCTCAPTDAELASLRQRQRLGSTLLIQQADEAHASGKGYMIGDIERDALLWMGDERVQDRPWLKKIQEVAVKPCAACAKTILAAATVCEFCHTDLVRRCLDLGIEPENDPAVATVYQRVLEAREAKRKAVKG